MSRYLIGIDLGTTNSVVAWKDMEEEEGKIQFLSIDQLVKAGQVEERSVLPSFVYLPGEHELPKNSLQLPWDENLAYCVGEFAKTQGSKVPNRLVNSAKSWLSHRGVDRKAKILPFQSSAEDLEKISPVEASTYYLNHLRDCWNHKFADKKNMAFEKQNIYLTVPASFDAVARDLTVQAAKQAGLKVTLLEEPQAAFYAWIHNNEDDWRKALTVDDLILVVDVGGGTTDLSLVSVIDSEGNLELQRTAVGDHILLGGDNMDLALAHVASTKLPKAKLDIWQSRSLWYSCCQAKEQMFSDDSCKQVPISILGRGSSVIGGTLKTQLTAEDLQTTILEGFFPKIAMSEVKLDTGRKIGLSQMGLPYASEPAITKHIAQFLKQNAGEKEEFVAPTAILFNGGVFKAQKIQQHLTEVVNSWLQEAGKKPLRTLQSRDLDLSVAQGAAYYGQVKEGKGIRIRGGTSRSYFLGLESSMPAIPGVPTPMKALCVVPQGMEEGTEADVPETELGLVIGQPVEFPFFSSNQRKDTAVGTVLDRIPDDLLQSASVETTLEAKGIEEGQAIPVKLHSKVTEIGTLEIFCRSMDEKHSWQLEFNIRETLDE